MKALTIKKECARLINSRDISPSICYFGKLRKFSERCHYCSLPWNGIGNTRIKSKKGRVNSSAKNPTGKPNKVAGFDTTYSILFLGSTCCACRLITFSIFLDFNY